MAQTKTNGASARSKANRARSSKPASSAPKKAPEAVATGVQDTATTLSDVVSKVKIPLLVGSAALAGLAGGVAVSRNAGRKGVQFPKLGNQETIASALGATAKALGNAAAEAGKAGYRVGELTSEVRRVREEASASKRR